MSIEALTWANQIKLPPLEKLVLMVLAMRHHPDSGLTCPSIKRMSETCGMSTQGVRKCLRSMQTKGILYAKHRREGNTNLTNDYRFNFGGTFELCHEAPKPWDGLPGGLHPVQGGGPPTAPGAGGVVHSVQEGTAQRAGATASGAGGVLHSVQEGTAQRAGGTAPGAAYRDPVNTSPLSPSGKLPPAAGEASSSVIRFAVPGRRAAKIQASGARRRSLLDAPRRSARRRPALDRPVLPFGDVVTPLVKAVGYERFEPFKSEFLQWYRELNAIAVEEVPWGVAEDRALVLMLNAEPRLDADEVHRRLANRWASVEAGESNKRLKCPGRRVPLQSVIEKLSMYANGPVNNWGDAI